MIGHQLYPTPPEIVAKMISMVHKDHWGAKVLEPSAGTGNILQAIGKRLYRNFDGTNMNQWDRNSDTHKHNLHDALRRMLFCEIDPTLSAALVAQGYSMAGTDFLQYGGRPDIGAIVMNPPFDCGDTHLLHAWEILSEGSIVCLLNSQTVLNDYTSGRQLLRKLIEDHGKVQHLGQVFASSERKTQVHTSMVVLTKTCEKWRQVFGGFEARVDPGYQAQEVNDIMSTDFIESRVGLYNATVAAFDEMAVKYGAIVSMIKTVGDGFMQADARKQAIDLELEPLKANALATQDQIVRRKELEERRASLTYVRRVDANEIILRSFGIPQSRRGDTLYTEHKTPQQMMSEFRDRMTDLAWNDLLDATQLQGRMSSRAKAEFDKLRTEQNRVAFTAHNIRVLLQQLIESGPQIIRQAILDAFDHLTRYHTDNRVHIEGWATNDSYKVRQKFILPVLDSYGTMLNNTSRVFDDLDMALCYIEGKNHHAVTRTYKAVSAASRAGGEGETEFFTFKLYKKGTAHFTFKNKTTWEQFNLQVAIARGWLPETTNKKNKDWRV